MIRKYWFLLLLGFCAIGMLIGYLSINRLNSHYLVTFGIVKNIESSSKGGGKLVSYSYSIDNKNYNGKSVILYSQAYSSVEFKFLIGKTLAVVYDSKNPQNSEMLFLPNQYKRYKIQMEEKFQPIIDSVNRVVTE